MLNRFGLQFIRRRPTATLTNYTRYSRNYYNNFHQSTKFTNIGPISIGFLGFLFGSSVDYGQVKKDIIEIFDDYDWDDGSWGPVLIRLAWHASGTYDKSDSSGGANGSTMRYSPEATDDANAGLEHARKKLEAIKEKHSNLTYADLWILAAYTAIEEMGGPVIEFRSGRTDDTSNAKCPVNGRLPDAALGAQHIRDVFYRMGFNDEEIVVLVGGGHAIGRCHTDRSGFDGPWTRSPTTVSNEFYRLLLDEVWVEKKWKGPKQFEDKSTGKLMMLPTDIAMRTDPEFRKYCEVYKNDNEKFLKDFGVAFKKLTELGF